MIKRKMKQKNKLYNGLLCGLLALAVLLTCFSVFSIGNKTTAKALETSPLIVKDFNGEKCLDISGFDSYDLHNRFYNLLITIYDEDYQIVQKRYKVNKYLGDSFGYCVPLSILIHVGGLHNYTAVAFASIGATQQSMVDIEFTPFSFSYTGKTPLPTPPIKDGYTFVEWCLDEALTIPYDGREVTADLQLYAKFKISTYTVTFYSSGGSAVESQVVDWNTAATLATPTRIGYDFVGWFIGETQYTDGGIKANTALTAKWTIKVFTVTFMVDNVVYKTVEVDYGTTFARALQAANLAYFKAVNSSGESLDKTTAIEENTILSVVEMTQNEKVGEFIANNSWILWTAGGAIIVLCGIVAILISKKRG